MLLKFWGTRGSIPSPLSPQQIEQKVRAALEKAGQENLDLTDPGAVQKLALDLAQSLKGSTVGGNTTCVTIEIDNQLIIFDDIAS